MFHLSLSFSFDIANFARTPLSNILSFPVKNPFSLFLHTHFHKAHTQPRQ